MSGILTGISVPPSEALLFDQTLLADTSSIDSGSAGFSLRYNHLLVIAYCRTTEAVVGSQVNLRFNNDSSAGIYNRQALRGSDTTASAGQGVGQAQISITSVGANAQTGVFSAYAFFVPAYAQTVGHKMLIGLSGRGEETAGDQMVEPLVGHYESTNAIDRIQIIANSGNLVTGSRLSIYGI